MAVTINASTTSGLVQSADTSGVIQLQSNGATVATAQSTGFQINTYTAGASLITSATAQNTTSGTSIPFTGIPSWVKRITVIFNGVSTNGTSRYQIQIGSGSTTTSGYASIAGAVGSNANTTTSSGSNTTGFVLNGYSTATTQFWSGSAVLHNISGNIWVCSGVLADTSAGIAVTSFGGNVTLSGTLDRVVLTTVNGTDTFDAGSVNILYE